MRILLVATEEPIAARGWACVLGPPWELRSCRCDWPTIEKAAAEMRPQVLLVDAGPDLTLGLVSKLPKGNVAIWAREVGVELACQLVAAGVRGIVRKDWPMEEQLRAMEELAQGNLWFEKRLSDRMISQRRVILTPREGQLASCVARGLSNKEVAFELGITVGTVKSYLSRIFRKVAVESRHELALYALRNLVADPGWRPPYEVRRLTSMVVDPAA